MSKKLILDYLIITVAIFFMSAAFYFFLEPNNLVTGGVTGLSIIISHNFGINTGAFILIANLLLLTVGTIILGKDFFFKTAYGSIIYPGFMILFEYTVPNTFFIDKLVNDQLFLSSLIAGAIVGVGLGILLKKNATTGGMDVVQKVVSDITKKPVSLAIYLTDGIIILLGMTVFGFEMAVYAMISMIVVAFVVDKVLLGTKGTIAVNIITTKGEELKDVIYSEIKRGVSEMKVTGGYTKSSRDLLLCIIDREQYHKLIKIVENIDDDAFIFANNIFEVKGQGFTKAIRTI